MSAERFASHDDDPEAPLVDRLLLALGMWPSYVTELGEDAVIEAAVVIRGNAHRYPMAAEDYGRVDDTRVALVQAVLELIPPGWRPDVKGYEDELDSVDEFRAFAYLHHLAQAQPKADTP